MWGWAPSVHVSRFLFQNNSSFLPWKRCPLRAGEHLVSTSCLALPKKYIYIFLFPKKTLQNVSKIQWRGWSASVWHSWSRIKCHMDVSTYVLMQRTYTICPFTITKILQEENKMTDKKAPLEQFLFYFVLLWIITKT